MAGYIIAVLLSYVVGSIPNGLIWGKMFWDVDLRTHGSRNIGATNAWRTIGKAAGILIFLLDFLKGVLAVYFGILFVGSPLAMTICGLVAIGGHSASVFLGFKGGKGVATGLGVIAMLMPKVTLIVFLLWLAIVYATRYVSLGSIVAAVCVPLLAYFFDNPREYVLFGTIAAALIVVRHHANISRLLNGTESKIKSPNN